MITITINNQTTRDDIQTYIDLLQAISGRAQPLSVTAPAEPTAAPEAARQLPTANPSEAPTAPPRVLPVADAPMYTIDQIKTAAAQLRDAGKLEDLRALNKQFGIPKTSALQPPQYGAYIAAMRDLGARI